MREQLVFAIDFEVEILSPMGRALVVENLHEERQRLFLDVAPRIEIDPKPIELIFAIARAEPEREAAVAQNIDECRVLRDPQRVGEGERPPQCRS